MHYTRDLNRLIDDYLEKRISLLDFQQRYSQLFVDQIPDDALDRTGWDLYGEIHEKSEWTAENPPPEDRKVGWLTADDFRSWLLGKRRELPADT